MKLNEAKKYINELNSKIYSLQNNCTPTSEQILEYTNLQNEAMNIKTLIGITKVITNISFEGTNLTILALENLEKRLDADIYYFMDVQTAEEVTKVLPTLIDSKLKVRTQLELAYKETELYSYNKRVNNEEGD